MSDLRKKIIKLAYEKPELRDDLLPLLEQPKVAAAAVDLQSVQMVLRARDGDTLTIHSPKLRKPRVVTVSGRPKAIKGLIYLSVSSGPRSSRAQSRRPDYLSRSR